MSNNFENQVMDTLSIILDKLGDVDNRTIMLEKEIKEVKQEVKALDVKVDKLDKKVNKIEITLENETNKKIDTLYDGFKMSIEKNQEVIERQKRLEKRVEVLEVKVG